MMHHKAFSEPHQTVAFHFFTHPQKERCGRVRCHSLGYSCFLLISAKCKLAEAQVFGHLMLQDWWCVSSQIPSPAMVAATAVSDFLLLEWQATDALGEMIAAMR